MNKLPKFVTFEDVKALPTEQFIEICRQLANEKFEKISNEDFIMNAREALSTFEELIRDHYNENYLKEDCQNCLNSIIEINVFDEENLNSKRLLDTHIEGSFHHLKYANDVIYALSNVIYYLNSIKYSCKNLKRFIKDRTTQERISEELTILFESLTSYIKEVSNNIFLDFYRSYPIYLEYNKSDEYINSQAWIYSFKNGKKGINLILEKVLQIIQNFKNLEPIKENIKFILSIIEEIMNFQKNLFAKFINKFINFQAQTNNVNKNCIWRLINESSSYDMYDQIFQFVGILQQIESSAIEDMIDDNLDNDENKLLSVEIKRRIENNESI